MKCKHCNGTGKSNMYKDGEFVDCMYCGGTGKIEVNMTNEEWFCQLSTEEKAKVLRRKTYGNSEDNEAIEQGWANWLKAKHEDNPPDIPSVPSWDKWLEGERTKCEYCDGTNAECNLVGKFECPKTPKTEQEYIQNCTTEQLAEKLTDFSFMLVVELPTNERREKVRNKLLEWLKQPHKEE